MLSLFDPDIEHKRRGSAVIADWTHFEASVTHIGRLRHMRDRSSDLFHNVAILRQWLAWVTINKRVLVFHMMRRYLSAARRIAKCARKWKRRRDDATVGIFQMWKTAELETRGRCQQTAKNGPNNGMLMKYAYEYATTFVPDALKEQVVTDLYWERLRQWQRRFRAWLQDAKRAPPKDTGPQPHFMEKYRALFNTEYMTGLEQFNGGPKSKKGKAAKAGKAPAQEMQALLKPDFLFDRRVICLEELLEAAGVTRAPECMKKAAAAGDPHGDGAASDVPSDGAAAQRIRGGGGGDGDPLRQSGTKRRPTQSPTRLLRHSSSTDFGRERSVTLLPTAQTLHFEDLGTTSNVGRSPSLASPKAWQTVLIRPGEDPGESPTLVGNAQSRKRMAQGTLVRATSPTRSASINSAATSTTTRSSSPGARPASPKLALSPPQRSTSPNRNFSTLKPKPGARPSSPQLRSLPGRENGPAQWPPPPLSPEPAAVPEIRTQSPRQVPPLQSDGLRRPGSPLRRPGSPLRRPGSPLRRPGSPLRSGSPRAEAAAVGTDSRPSSAGDGSPSSLQAKLLKRITEATQVDALALDVHATVGLAAPAEPTRSGYTAPPAPRVHPSSASHAPSVSASAPSMSPSAFRPLSPGAGPRPGSPALGQSTNVSKSQPTVITLFGSKAPSPKTSPGRRAPGSVSSAAGALPVSPGREPPGSPPKPGDKDLRISSAQVFVGSMRPSVAKARATPEPALPQVAERADGEKAKAQQRPSASPVPALRGMPGTLPEVVEAGLN